MKKGVAVKAENISKVFMLPHERQDSIKTSIINIFSKKDSTVEAQEALKDISFEVKKGDFFGIVGKNGSGKSTLLKIIAGIYQPTSGKISIDGKLVSFIELGVGFNSELTGRENVYLNGALLGFTKKQIDNMYDDIVEFAELEKFMDQRLKNYSSGMQVRLAFSVAIKAKGDILVLDEVLAVGDEAFQRKCAEFFRSIKNDKSKTVILVTHSMDSVREYCNKALLIDDGLVEINSSDVDTVADKYSKLFIKKSKDSDNEDNRFGSGEVIAENIKEHHTKEKIYLSLDVINKTETTYEDVYIGVNIKYDGKVIAGNHMRYVSGYRNGFNLNAKEIKHFDLELDNILTKNDYTVDISIKNGGGAMNFDTIRDVVKISQPNPGSSRFYKLTMPLSVNEKERRK